MTRVRAATLSVGTEITDGQIVDRNSAWISQRLADQGVSVIEHRAVPDDRARIREALAHLSGACELLFVTGGLGPTSDDFTREVIAGFFMRQLRFHQPSWEHVQARLRSRGVSVRESQRRQCEFPEGAEILDNPLGTANGFALEAGAVRVFVLPGPPAEIAAIWERGIEARLSSLVPQRERERLFIWRCLGRGESEVAEIAESFLGGLGLRLGYRAHVPYVETKAWVTESDLERVKAALAAFEESIEPWLVNKDKADLAEDLIRWVSVPGRSLRVHDAATFGLLDERISQKRHETGNAGRDLDLLVETRHAPPPDARVWVDSLLRGLGSPTSAILALAPDPVSGSWVVGCGAGDRREISAPRPVFRLDLRAERSRKHVTEKSLQAFCRFVGAGDGRA